MGGYAAIIPGTVAERALQPRPAPPSLLDRILGRRRMRGPVESGGMIELPQEDFRPLAAEFGAFLRRSMPAPWEATQIFLEYLAIPALEVHVRGSRGSPAWTLEFSFSGCAGMAEVSAELGSHWVEIWFQREGPRIQAELLSAPGFEAQALTAPAGAVFVPFEGLGYGRRMDEPASPDVEGSRIFEFDYSLTETLEQQGSLASLRALDAKFGGIGADGTCRCQLCSPQLSPLTP
jgi:hypothetical protein